MKNTSQNLLGAFTWEAWFGPGNSTRGTDPAWRNPDSTLDELLAAANPEGFDLPLPHYFSLGQYQRVGRTIRKVEVKRVYVPTDARWPPPSVRA